VTPKHQQMQFMWDDPQSSETHISWADIMALVRDYPEMKPWKPTNIMSEAPPRYVNSYVNRYADVILSAGAPRGVVMPTS